MFTELYIIDLYSFIDTRHHTCCSVVKKLVPQFIRLIDKAAHISLSISSGLYYKLVKISGGKKRQLVLDVYQGNTFVFILAS